MVTLPTQMTFRPPFPTIVSPPLKVPIVWVHGRAASSAARLRASVTCWLRFWLFCTCPVLPEPLLLKLAPDDNRMLLVTNWLPVIASLPPSAMQMSPSMPPAGPVMETDPPSSSRTVQIGGCAPPPIRGLAQLVGHGGLAAQTFSSLLVTVRPVAPTTSQVTTTSSQASFVRPLTLPVADAVAFGSSDAMVAGVVGTGVPVCVGGQVMSFSKMLSVIAQFASATPPVFVTVNVIWFTPLASCAAHTLLIETLATGHTSWSVAGGVFLGCEGLAGSTESLISHVTATVLQAFVVSPVTLPITVVDCPAGSEATPVTVTSVEVVVVGGQVGSFGNTLSVTTQFWRSAVPVFISVTSTSFVPSAAWTLHSFVTASPGVRHWNFASSNAVACTSPGVGVQSHVTVALSGSAAESVAEQSAWFAPDVNTHAPLTHVACALPQSTSATHAPASDPTLTVVGNPALPSVMEHVKRSAVPALATA